MTDIRLKLESARRRLQAARSVVDMPPEDGHIATNRAAMLTMYLEMVDEVINDALETIDDPWIEELPDPDTDLMFWVWGPELKVEGHGQNMSAMATYGMHFGSVRWVSLDHFDQDHDPLPIDGVTHWAPIPIPGPPS